MRLSNALESSTADAGRIGGGGTSQRAALVVQETHNDGEVVEDANSVADAIAVVGPQLRIAQREIGRMKGIIDDASSELFTSFCEIQGAFGREDINLTGTGADLALTRAMTALQFQDMVGQLMSGLSQRIGVATEMLDSVSSRGAVPKPGLHFPRQVVLQQDVGSGDVELF